MPFSVFCKESRSFLKQILIFAEVLETYADILILDWNMKKLAFVFMASLCALTVAAQDFYQEKTVFKNDDVEIRQIDEHTWHGNGHQVYNESIYIVAGDSAAILIDAGTHIPGLKKIVEDIAGMPVTLVATHVHPDHTGSAVNEWDEIWINAADEVNTRQNLRGFSGTKRYLTDGQVFNLGGRRIEVIFTPGHTPGSTTFVDPDAHYGFSGDAFGSTNLLVSTSLSTQAATCARMERFIRKYDIKFFYPGHYYGNDVETPQRVSDVRKICEGILDGTETPVRGDNRSLPNVVEKYGVKVNFGEKQKR